MNFHYRFRNLLPVGTNILHRRSADISGDPAEAFDTCKIVFDARSDKVVPILACAGPDGSYAVRTVRFVRVCSGSLPELRTVDADVDDDAVETFVGDQYIAPAAQNEDRKFAFLCKRKGGDKRGFSLSFNKVLCGPANT